MEFACLRLELPSNNGSLRWRRLQELYKSLHNVKDTNALLTILQEIFCCVRNETQSSSDLFSGLELFLDSIVSSQERHSFFETILPEIANFASLIDVKTLSTNTYPSSSTKDFRLVLTKNSIASLLASAFLCAIPSITGGFDFLDIYKDIQSVELKDIAVVKLQTVLQYFKCIASRNIDMTGEVVFEKQVIESSSLPTIEYWASSDVLLCPVIVEHEKQKQDPLNSCEKVTVCGSFHGKVASDKLEIRESVEALVATWFVDELQENEVLIIKHCNEASDREERLVTNKLSSINEDTEDLPSDLILRYLNKALMCFDSEGALCERVDYGDDDYDDEDENHIPNELQDEDCIQYLTDEELSCEKKPNCVAIEITDINGNVTIPGIDSFCQLLVGQAYNQAREEIDMTSEDHRDMFEDLMKKSLHELFHKTPEKEKLFSDSIIHSPLLPKCLLHFHSNGDVSTSSLVPSTPPSSPAAKRGLVTNGRQSPQGSPSQLVEELRLGSKSFADSLAEALMSCVLLSSSLATSIATESLDPLSTTSVTMGMFQKSPHKSLDGQNGSSKIYSNQCDSSLEVLTNQKLNSDLIDVSSDALSTDSDDDHEARRQSLNELALNLFENFASKLSGSIIQTATSVIFGDSTLEYVVEDVIDLESEANAAYDVDLYQEDLQEWQSEKSVSESDIDQADDNWYDMDIDKELEDKLYELDLTDNEEFSISSQRSLSDMADDVIAVALRSAVSEAASEIDSRTIEISETEDAGDLEGGISYEDDLANEPNFLENAGLLDHGEADVSQESPQHNQLLENPGDELIKVFASDICVNIIQDVLEGLRYDADMLNGSSTSSQNVADIHSTLAEIDESEDVDVSDVSSESSMDQTAELIQFVEVLTEQVVETGAAIASSAYGGGNHRHVVTSIWCSDDGVVDVQMEAVLQWLAASAVGRPAVVFHAMWDPRLDKFSTVYRTLRENHYKVCDVLDIILRYTQSEEARDASRNLFDFLLDSLS